MVPKAERKAVEFLNRGMQTSRPISSLSDGRFALLQNVRAYQDGLVMTRPGQSALTAVAVDTPIHSIERLNNDLPGASQFAALIVGGGTKLYTSNSTFSTLTERDTGYSGNYLSMVPHRPTQSAEPWMYIADANKMRKIKVDGTDFQMGIAPPNTAPAVAIGAPIRTTISDFEAAGAWTNAGDAGAIAVASRLTGATTITRIIYDSGTTGLASVQPSILDDNIQAGMFLIVDAAGTPETFVVERVFRSIVNTTIARITYDAGNTGRCTIQLTASSVGLERDALILINSGGGTAEAVRIESVTEGPDGLASIRVSTTNNHAAAETVDGLGSFRAYFTATHAAAQTLTTNKFRSTITFATGVGYLNLVSAMSLATSSNRPLQPDDEIHISLRIDDPSKLLEARIMFDVDANTNDFTRNYYYYSITQNALTQALQNTVTTATAQQRIAQQQQLDEYYQRVRSARIRQTVRNYESMDMPDPFDLEDVPLPPWITSLPDAITETTAGNNQWTELVFKVKDLIRVGADESRTLKNVAALRIQFQISATIVVDVDAWWIGGTYGPDATGGSPYLYCYTARNKATGAVSNPSPPIRSGISPVRQRVAGTLTQHTDAQVDQLDVYRFGGSLNEWHYVLTTANSATPTFTDDFPDDVIVANPGLDEDNYQPFPSTDVPRSGTANASGTKVRWRSGDIFNASWGRNSLVRIGGVTYSLYSQPTVTALTVTNATNATPIVITTSTNHGLNTGDGVRVAGVGGNTAANGDWVVTAISATTFSLDTSVGNGAYTSGGTATKYDLETNENVGNLANSAFELPDALLLGQSLPVMWGPYGGGLGGVFMFACGDPRLPGVLFITKGNNPDSSFYRLEITSGSEELVSGCIYDGRCYVFSTKRMYAVEPVNGGQDWVAREVANSIGLQSRWGLCVGDHIYFVGATGIYRSDGGQPYSLTKDSISTAFLEDATPSSTLEDVTALARIFTSTNYRLDFANGYLFINYNNVVYNTLLYDTKRDVWMSDVYEGSRTVTHFSSNLQPGHQSLFTIMGGIDGKLYKLDSAVTLDAGTSFICAAYTKFDDCGDARADKMFAEVWLDATPVRQIEILLDTGNSYVSGTFLESFTMASSSTRTTKICDLNSGAGHLIRNLGARIVWSHANLNDAPVRLYNYQLSYYPKTERTALRFTDWTDAGYVGDKRVTGFVVRADTFNVAKTFAIQYDGGTVAAPTTFNITHNGEKSSAFAFSTPMIAKLLRVTSADTDQWNLYDVEFQYERYPELLALVPDFSDDGDPRAKWLQGFEIEADTSGASCTLRLDCDNTVGVQSFTINHNGRRITPFSLDVPFICHTMRLVPTSGTLRLFKIKWIWEPEPDLVEEWIGQPTTLDISGYKHVKEVWVTHRSAADWNFILVIDNTTTITIPVTSSGGVMKKERLQLPPNKGMMYQPKATGANMRIYQREIEVLVKGWGDNGAYRRVQPIGDVSRLQGARI